MSALFVRPEAFTVTAATQSTLQPASNLNIDHAGLIWAMPSAAGTATITVQGSGQLIDTIALIGSNLAPSDTIKYRVGTDTTTLNAASYSVAQAAYTGATVAAPFTTKSVIKLASPVAFNLIQISLTMAVAKIVTAQRLVVGKAISTMGIEMNAESGVLSRSQAISGPGWASTQTFGNVPTWKAKCSFISGTSWRSEWLPFLMNVGIDFGFLFVPNDADMHPHDVMFGTMDSAGKGQIPGWDAWAIEMNITAKAP